MPFDRSRAWHAEEEHLLLEMAAAGTSTARLAARFRRSKAAVEKRIKLLKKAEGGSHSSEEAGDTKVLRPGISR
jgi:hypothetical protein